MHQPSRLRTAVRVTRLFSGTREEPHRRLRHPGRRRHARPPSCRTRRSPCSPPARRRPLAGGAPLARACSRARPTSHRRSVGRRSGSARCASPCGPVRASIPARSLRGGISPRYDVGEVPLGVLFRRRPPESGRGQARPGPSHTTRHAGPHRAVRSAFPETTVGLGEPFQAHGLVPVGVGQRPLEWPGPCDTPVPLLRRRP